ncbi:MAG: hypothetical protein QOD74_2239 [Variibacter sp.]|nr:hypothetical protein [Variibacter sp.]
MSGEGLFGIDPSAADVAIAKRSAALASPSQQTILRNVTKGADENPMMIAVAAVWLGSRFSRNDQFRRDADQLLCVGVVSTALPHVLKRVFRRQRPDRSYLHLANGIRRSGNAWDSFPSGHAVHVGAVARSVSRMLPRAARPLLWPGLAGLVGTRLLVLAHYPTDVLAGLGVGFVIDGMVAHALTLVRGAGRSSSHASES